MEEKTVRSSVSRSVDGKRRPASKLLSFEIRYSYSPFGQNQAKGRVKDGLDVHDFGALEIQPERT
ncbi:hypothetical protein C1H46_035876 [Malus baccata]|uniref:Uncharacterized protein n=1 Tax=Malus baccata TaxID=106549 RepID=A0A540KWP6_MALBA|nr:hypothetical protein C1H46_035876 [Malus baccata]